ncbi:MAG: hypothetical protein IPM46_09650 [Flavobacteriales bacterium]|nr:hypothetical protein [Flavobacteriales bacterium]
MAPDVHNADHHLLCACAKAEVHIAGRFVRDAAALAGPFGTSAEGPLARRAAADAMDLDLDREPTGFTRCQAGSWSSPGIAYEPIRARSIYQPVDDGRLRLAWELTIRSRKSASWWNLALMQGRAACCA